MAPQAQRSSEPASMLWAYQLKREHGFLADRMRKLEATIEQISRQAKVAETVVTNHTSAINARLQALSDAGDGQKSGLGELRADILARMDEMKAGMEAVVATVSTIDGEHARVEEERRRSLEHQKLVLKRVADLEMNLAKYEESLTLLGRRIDGAAARTIRDHLDELRDEFEESRVDALDVAEIVEKLKFVEQSVEMFEASNAKLAEEIETMRSMQVTEALNTSHRVLSPMHSRPDVMDFTEKQPAVTSSKRKRQDDEDDASCQLQDDHAVEGHATFEPSKLSRSPEDVFHDALASNGDREDDDDDDDDDDENHVKSDLPLRDSRGKFQKAGRVSQGPNGVHYLVSANGTVQARDSRGKFLKAARGRKTAARKDNDSPTPVERGKSVRQSMSRTTRMQSNSAQRASYLQNDKNLRQSASTGRHSTASARKRRQSSPRTTNRNVFDSETESEAEHARETARPTRRKRRTVAQDSDDEEMLLLMKMER